MQNSITWVGMDVHAENIVLAALRDSSDAILFRAEFPNTPKGRERLAGRLAENVPVRCVYEAGPRTSTPLWANPLISLELNINNPDFIRYTIPEVPRTTGGRPIALADPSAPP